MLTVLENSCAKTPGFRCRCDNPPHVCILTTKIPLVEYSLIQDWASRQIKIFKLADPESFLTVG